MGRSELIKRFSYGAIIVVKVSGKIRMVQASGGNENRKKKADSSNIKKQTQEGLGGICSTKDERVIGVENDIRFFNVHVHRDCKHGRRHRLKEEWGQCMC